MGGGGQTGENAEEKLSSCFPGVSTNQGGRDNAGARSIYDLGAGWWSAEGVKVKGRHRVNGV